jgi:hypothetical protein
MADPSLWYRIVPPPLSRVDMKRSITDITCPSNHHIDQTIQHGYPEFSYEKINNMVEGFSMNNSIGKNL